MDDAGLARTLVDKGLAEVQTYTWQCVWPVLSATYADACPPVPPIPSVA